MNIIFLRKRFYFFDFYDTIIYIIFSEENMKDTKDDKIEEKQEKINFQSLRKCMSNDYCRTYNWKCDFNLLYDELIRI